MTSGDIAAGITDATPAPVKAVPTARQYISWGALALMTVGSVGDLGSAPAMAVFGFACVFLYVLPAIVFLVPTALVSAELASGWPGGVYNWVSEGISAPMGLLAIWCQFAQTVFYYPALLAYVGSTLAYVIDPRLAGNGVYTAAVIIVLFWGGVLVSSRGLHLIAKLASSGIVLGTLVPGAILVVMGLVYLIQGYHPAAPMDAAHLLPAWSGLASIVLIVSSFFTYAGIEMNAVHVDELRNPAREFPKAIFVAMGLVLAVFIFPTLAISWAIPSQQISLTAGVMQALTAFLAHFGLIFAVPLIAVALVVASLSGMMAWLAGPSKGLLNIGREQGHLPPFFQQVNAAGIQMHILVAQGVVITLIGLLYAFVPSVSSAYWIFAAMATQVYLIMYVLMFVAARNLRRRQPEHPRGYSAPALVPLCLIGGLSSAAAFVIGFVPPSQFGRSNPLIYGALLLGGVLLIGVVPPVLLFRLRKPSWKGGHVVAPAGMAFGDALRRRHRLITRRTGAILVVLALLGVVIYRHGRDDPLARARADRVLSLFVAHHLSVPLDQRTLIDVLGTNGGPVCANPNAALIKALEDEQLATGATTVGARPIRADRRVIEGRELAIAVYCPDELANYRSYINGKRYYPVIRR
jgi:glutamate:GABA antiporter